MSNFFLLDLRYDLLSSKQPSYNKLGLAIYLLVVYEHNHNMHYTTNWFSSTKFTFHFAVHYLNTCLIHHSNLHQVNGQHVWSIEWHPIHILCTIAISHTPNLNSKLRKDKSECFSEQLDAYWHLYFNLALRTLTQSIFFNFQGHVHIKQKKREAVFFICYKLYLKKNCIFLMGYVFKICFLEEHPLVVGWC